MIRSKPAVGVNSASNTSDPPAKRISKKRTASRVLNGSSSGGTSSNVAPRKSSSTPSPKTNRLLRSETSAILTVGPPNGLRISQSSELNVFQLLNIENPLRDEVMFLLCVRDFGLKTATFLATRFHWKHQRPLQALLAMTNESGRSCTKQNAGPRPLSNFPASSRKRS